MDDRLCVQESCSGWSFRPPTRGGAPSSPTSPLPGPNRTAWQVTGIEHIESRLQRFGGDKSITYVGRSENSRKVYVKCRFKMRMHWKC